MPTINKNNYISIAKAIGIILMVIGHSGCPALMSNFKYLFHMPLFITCSGFFFKDTTKSEQLRQFSIKRLNGLYFPYLKWSILFLLLHNLFYHLHIYEQPYHTNKFLWNLGKILFMTDFEILLRPFWFLKALLFSSIIVAGITFLKNKYQLNIRYIELLAITLFITFLFKLLNVHLGSVFFPGIINMRYTNKLNLFIYFPLSTIGIIFILSISKVIQKKCNYTFKKTLYFIGNNTMSILALNLLALRIGNFLKIEIYQLPIDKMSSHTIISEYNDYFWLLYMIIGISIPLLLNFLYKKLYQYLYN